MPSTSRSAQDVRDLRSDLPHLRPPLPEDGGNQERVCGAPPDVRRLRELCHASERLSAWENVEMAPIACEACAKACEQCAAACEKHPEDKRLVECAKSCRDCAKSCRDMVKMMAK